MGSSPLHAKQALFDDWGLSEDEDTKPSFFALSLAKNVKREDHANKEADIKPRLDDAEVEHRRKSKAFAVAAMERKQRKAERKELKRRRQEEELEKEREKERKKEREEEREKERQEEQRKQRQQRHRPARREIIDLTGPTVTPIPPPQIPPPPRRAQSAVEFVRKSATLRRTSSNPLPSSQTGRAGRAGQANKKRKIEIPSSGSSSTKREIFTDLSFYYLPDSALGARKMRIAKAQQHGATWVRNPEEATHVIVDMPFTWAEIESAIEARRPDAVVVYDEYPLDCIAFRCLLNPSQRRYQIKGRDEVDTSTEKTEKTEKTRPTKETYTIKPARRLAGSSSRSREREQMIRQPRKG